MIDYDLATLYVSWGDHGDFNQSGFHLCTFVYVFQGGKEYFNNVNLGEWLFE